MRSIPSSRIIGVSLSGLGLVVATVLLLILVTRNGAAAKTTISTGAPAPTGSRRLISGPTPTTLARVNLATPNGKQGPTGASKPAPGGEPVTITGQAIWGDYDKKTTYISGDIRIVQGKTLITTDRAELNTGKKTAVFSNNVKLSHPDVTITAELLEYDLKQKTGTFKQQVTLNRIETKDDEGKSNRDPFTLTADQLYFESDTKNFKAIGRGQIKHKEFTGLANTIEYRDQEQKMIFRGAVEIVQDSTTIRAEMIELDLNRKRLIIPKAAESSETDVTITAEELDYDYDHKIGTFKNQVVLNRLDVEDPKQKTKKDPFKLTADELSFDSDSNNFVARGNGTVEHKEFTGTADSIEYDDAAQTLLFEGNAILKRPKGESIKGAWIRINLDEETFTVRNNAVTELNVDSKD